MTILAFILWFVTALFALGVFTYSKDKQPKNKVHFYVARDKNKLLYLYLDKPIRSRFSFYSDSFGTTITSSYYFSKYGLNEDDYANLKWEDEPVEVFLNMED